MKQSSVALLLAIAMMFSQHEKALLVVAMFLCTSFICRAIEELKK